MGVYKKQSFAAATLMKMPLESVELGNEKPLNVVLSRMQLNSFITQG